MKTNLPFVLILLAIAVLAYALWADQPGWVAGVAVCAGVCAAGAQWTMHRNRYYTLKVGVPYRILFYRRVSQYEWLSGETTVLLFFLLVEDHGAHDIVELRVREIPGVIRFDKEMGPGYIELLTAHGEDVATFRCSMPTTSSLPGYVRLTSRRVKTAMYSERRVPVRVVQAEPASAA